MNRYYNQIFNDNNQPKINTLYDVGESGLSENDVIYVDDVACYVLEINNFIAKLITKDIYNQSFVNYEGKCSNATNDIFGYLDKFYFDHFKDNSSIIETNTSYKFNYYPLTISRKLFLLSEEEAMKYSNGYSIGLDKFGNTNIYNDKTIGFLIGSFSKNDAYSYGSFINFCGNLQIGYIYDKNIGVRPSFNLNLR